MDVNRMITGFKRLIRSTLELVVMVAVAYALSMGFKFTIAEAYAVPTGSMEPTIMTNDRVVAEKLSLWFRKPEAGDVIVFKNPGAGPTTLIKRVIGLPGQSVDVRDGSVWVDGVKLAEPYTHGEPSEALGLPMPVTVPPDHVWVMGDNRTNSADSRVFGPVPIEFIMARALVIYWPFQHAGSIAGDQ